MKKTIIGIFFLILCAALGVGSLFFLRQGQRQYGRDQKPELPGLADITVQEGGSLPESVVQAEGTGAVKQVIVDTGRVDTKKAGSYPVYYYFTDRNGNLYVEEIRCTVKKRELPAETADLPKNAGKDRKTENEPLKETDAKAQAETKEAEPDTEAQEKTEEAGPDTEKSPRTGEESGFLFYTVSAVLSLAAAGKAAAYRGRYGKI